MCSGHHWASSVCLSSFYIRSRSIHNFTYRSLVTTLRAAEKFELAHLQTPEISKLVDGAKYFYVEGYFLTHGADIALYLAKKSSEAGKVSVFPYPSLQTRFLTCR